VPGEKVPRLLFLYFFFGMERQELLILEMAVIR